MSQTVNIDVITGPLMAALKHSERTVEELTTAILTAVGVPGGAHVEGNRVVHALFSGGSVFLGPHVEGSGRETDILKTITSAARRNTERYDLYMIEQGERISEPFTSVTADWDSTWSCYTVTLEDALTLMGLAIDETYDRATAGLDDDEETAE